MSKKYKLLILQGGGYYGLIDITFLSYLGKDYDLMKYINSISGTSIRWYFSLFNNGTALIQQIFNNYF